MTDHGRASRTASADGSNRGSRHDPVRRAVRIACTCGRSAESSRRDTDDLSRWRQGSGQSREELRFRLVRHSGQSSGASLGAQLGHAPRFVWPRDPLSGRWPGQRSTRSNPPDRDGSLHRIQWTRCLFPFLLQLLDPRSCSRGRPLLRLGFLPPAIRPILRLRQRLLRLGQLAHAGWLRSARVPASSLTFRLRASASSCAFCSRSSVV